MALPIPIWSIIALFGLFLQFICSIVILFYTKKPVPAWLRYMNLVAWFIVAFSLGFGIFSLRKKSPMPM